ncbi:Autophagy-related protein, partial [Globisporangium splendens]
MPFYTWLELIQSAHVSQAVKECQTAKECAPCDSLTPHSFTVFGSSTGSLVFYAALILGVESVGIEILPFLCQVADSIQSETQIPTAYCRFICEDLLQSSLSQTKILMLTSQCWDPELHDRVVNKLERELPVGSIVIDYKDTLCKSRYFQLVDQLHERQVSWNPHQSFFVFECTDLATASWGTIASTRAGWQHLFFRTLDNTKKDQQAAAMKSAETGKNDLLFLSFNQEASCISVGTRQGFGIYNCEPFGKVFQEHIGGIGIAEMLYCTSLVALVGAAVLAVRMNRQRLVAVLERKIYIFDINSMKILETLDTSPNPNALCVLSPHDNGHLAFPSGASPGEIVLYDANNLSVLNAFQAHRAAPVAMAFNSQGTLLATASETGTLIRVFGVPGGKKKASFRRGSYPAQIYCLAFNESSTILCASSDTGTIHFFSLTGTESTATGSFGHFTPITSTLAVAGSTFGSTAFGGVPPSPMSTTSDGKVTVSASPSRPSRSGSATNLEDVAGAMSAYLPSSLTGMAEGTRDFAYDASNPVVQLYVATADGYFYEYSLNLATGGKCKLERARISNFRRAIQHFPFCFVVEIRERELSASDMAVEETEGSNNDHGTSLARLRLFLAPHAPTKSESGQDSPNSNDTHDQDQDEDAETGEVTIPVAGAVASVSPLSHTTKEFARVKYLLQCCLPGYKVHDNITMWDMTNPSLVAQYEQHSHGLLELDSWVAVNNLGAAMGDAHSYGFTSLDANQTGMKFTTGNLRLGPPLKSKGTQQLVLCKIAVGRSLSEDRWPFKTKKKPRSDCQPATTAFTCNTAHKEMTPTAGTTTRTPASRSRRRSSSALSSDVVPTSPLSSLSSASNLEQQDTNVNAIVVKQLEDGLTDVQTGCRFHEGKHVEFYCSVCELPVCVHCKMVGDHSVGEKGTYRLLTIADAYELSLRESLKSDPLVESRKSVIENKLHSLAKAKEDVMHNKEQVEAAIRLQCEQALSRLEDEVRTKMVVIDGEVLEYQRQLQQIEWTEDTLDDLRACSPAVEFLSVWNQHRLVRSEQRDFPAFAHGSSAEQVRGDLELVGRLQVVSGEQLNLVVHGERDDSSSRQSSTRFSRRSHDSIGISSGFQRHPSDNTDIRKKLLSMKATLPTELMAFSAQVAPGAESPGRNRFSTLISSKGVQMVEDIRSELLEQSTLAKTSRTSTFTHRAPLGAAVMSTSSSQALPPTPTRAHLRTGTSSTLRGCSIQPTTWKRASHPQEQQPSPMGRRTGLATDAWSTLLRQEIALAMPMNGQQ